MDVDERGAHVGEQTDRRLFARSRRVEERQGIGEARASSARNAGHHFVEFRRERVPAW